MDEPTAWVISVALVCATVIYIFRTVVNRIEAADREARKQNNR
jgi:hypothetical protein